MLLAVALTAALAALAGATARKAGAVLPPGNAVQQWDKIAEDTVVGSGAFQIEGLIYMAYVSEAMYKATSPAGFAGGSDDAAVVQAASQVLSYYFPTQAATIASLRQEAMAAIPNSLSKYLGTFYGSVAARGVILARTGDGLQTPIGSTSSFPTLLPGPGVWRLTPPAYLPPQIPWARNVKPFILMSPDQFRPPPPPSLSSPQWVAAFNEIKVHGSSTNPNTTETTVAKFWTANVVRQYNELARDVATSKGLGDFETARLVAMVNVVGADNGIATMDAKYHYLFWRPVTAIDPTSVSNDGFGPVPGFDDGNPATVEQPGWRPLITTPNHPEYPAAHGSLTSAEAEVFADFLGTDNINVDIHGFDPAGPPGNLNAVRHFATTADLRTEIVNARVWGGVHYRFSGEAGVTLGKQVADYDLSHGFGELAPW
jgi:hypothetical protein